MFERTATVEHDIPPYRYSEGDVANGFHLGKVTLIYPPTGIEWVGLNLISKLVVAPTTLLVGVRLCDCIKPSVASRLIPVDRESKGTNEPLNVDKVKELVFAVLIGLVNTLLIWISKASAGMALLTMIVIVLPLAVHPETPPLLGMICNF